VLRDVCAVLLDMDETLADSDAAVERSWRAWAVARIEPPLLITVDDVRAGKPAPEGYLLAARRLGATIERCLVVEDSIPGLAAGRAAGAITAALRGLPGDLQLDGLTDLARRLAACGRPVPNTRSKPMRSPSADTAHTSPPTAVATDRPAAW